jgi:hypothetical protein
MKIRTQPWGSPKKRSDTHDDAKAPTLPTVCLYRGMMAEDSHHNMEGNGQRPDPNHVNVDKNRSGAHTTMRRQRWLRSSRSWGSPTQKRSGQRRTRDDDRIRGWPCDPNMRIKHPRISTSWLRPSGIDRSMTWTPPVDKARYGSSVVRFQCRSRVPFFPQLLSAPAVPALACTHRSTYRMHPGEERVLVISRN